MTGPDAIIRAQLTKQGDALFGVIRRADDAQDTVLRQVPRSEWAPALVDHVETMAEGATVQVEITIDHAGTLLRAEAAQLASPPDDRDRCAAVRSEGFVNPYTFVPTLPRDDLAGTPMGNAPPPSHAYHAAGQWSGTLHVTLSTVTPMLLPLLTAAARDDQPAIYDVRTGPDGRPLIHGASFKGALRSAYETITASRYGVFFERHERLAYRAPASKALGLIPARVIRGPDGARLFRLCQGDSAWRAGNTVQYAAWVPAYRDRHLLRRLGELQRRQLTDHHGRQVWARVVLYQYERVSRSGRTTRFQVWRASHLARSRGEIERALATSPARDPERTGKLTIVAATPTRIVQGWLSATGHSIKAKHDERLFVETPGLDVRVEPEHEEYWRSVLRAYDVAHGYNDPNATYKRAPTDASGIVRSLHVPSDDKLRGLPPGTLVHVNYDRRTATISEVHPVMIGRLPFDAAPSSLLPESLRPTADRDQLSPAERLFGWVPTGGRDDGEHANDGASGYRGRLSVRRITCTTDDWRPDPALPECGITLAPLSSPKPTQFRFYASPDGDTGMPMEHRVGKSTGYANDGGLRGRKMYRWRQEDPGHWQPRADQEDPARTYLAMNEHRGKPKQLGTHRGWVRPQVTFEVMLQLDGVAEPELGALLWLLTRGDTAPLRLGAAKPYGFGVVSAAVDLDRTRLWDADGIRAGWLRLNRPQPAGAQRLAALADDFAATARANPVLLEATSSYLAAAGPSADPVYYPTTIPGRPQPESYRWFVENEKLHLGRGWALPHVRHRDQRLPYLHAGSDVTPTLGGDHRQHQD